MTKARQIIDDAKELILESDDVNIVDNALLAAHTEILELHTRALACHCECLAMNAENSAAVCLGIGIPYGDAKYYEAMRKWNLIDEKGSPV